MMTLDEIRASTKEMLTPADVEMTIEELWKISGVVHEAVSRAKIEYEDAIETRNKYPDIDFGACEIKKNDLIRCREALEICKKHERKYFKG